MNKININTCPYCQSKHLAKGYQVGDGSLFVAKVGLTGTYIEHTLCKDCGSIVYSRVDYPEKFKEMTLTNE